MLTPEQEQYIIHWFPKWTTMEIAKQLNVTRKAVLVRLRGLRKEGRLPRAIRNAFTSWSEEEEDYLREQWGIMTNQGVATHLGRTVHACEFHADSIGINRRMNVYTMNDVARLFGINHSTAKHWVEKGWIKAIRAGFKSGPYRAWSIDENSIERFIRTKPWAYNYKLMTPGDYWTNLAKDAWANDPYVTVKEACFMLGWGKQRVHYWLQRGAIPSYHRPKSGRSLGTSKGWTMVRKSDVPLLQIAVDNLLQEKRRCDKNSYIPGSLQYSVREVR